MAAPSVAPSHGQRRHATPQRDIIRFGRYQLDPVQGLKRGAQDVRVTAKSLAVLRALASRAGQVVSKEELFREVWPDTAVSDAALTTCIQELRRALGDDARRPRFIETLHRRGYRFVARASAEDTDAAAPRADAPVLPPAPEPPLVGREPVLERLASCWARAAGGARQVVFVTGEPGIGKSAVARAFVSNARRERAFAFAWGQCLERYGIGEPYQPLLEALMRLARTSEGTALVPALDRYAPSWLAQLPALLPRSRVPGARSAAAPTRERMLRELVDLIEAISSTPLLLWLEDLQWSDASTLDWVAAFARRPEPARVLLLATAWAPAALGGEHPLSALVGGLAVKGHALEIALAPLGERDLEEYVRRRCPPARAADSALPSLGRLLHQHTGGNPLFVSEVIAHLAARGVLREQDDGWHVARDLRPDDLGVPDDVRRMIERQIGQLLAEDRDLLEAASVAGARFAAAVVGAAARVPVNAAEAALARLASQQLFVEPADPVAWPDGTVASGFAFRHNLYRDVLYARVAAGRRVELHRAVGARMEAAFGDRAVEIAAELAMHFEQARDWRRAGLYREHAADNARRRGAYREARLHVDRALALLAHEPEDRRRTEREVRLRIGRGSATMAASGWGAASAAEDFSRARELAMTLGDTPELFPAVWGLWLFYWGHGPLDTAAQLASHLLSLAHAGAGDDRLQLQAHHACWATAFSQGDLAGALEHAAAGERLYDPSRHAAMIDTYGSHDAGVCARMFKARALALSGDPESARAASHEAIELARSLDHPLSLALASVFAAAVDHARRDPDGARAHARASAGIAREHGLDLVLAWASAFEGWAAVQHGEVAGGLERIAGSVAAARETGSDQFLPHLLGLLAEAHLASGRAREGLAAVEEALAIANRTGERFFEPELRRLRQALAQSLNPPLVNPQRS